MHVCTPPAEKVGTGNPKGRPKLDRGVLIFGFSLPPTPQYLPVLRKILAVQRRIRKVEPVIL